MSIPNWPIKNFEKLISHGSAIAIPINDEKTLYLLNIGTDITTPGPQAKDIVRDYQGFARSQFAFCALKDTLAVPYHFIKKVAMVFTLYHFCCSDTKGSFYADKFISWAKDLGRIVLLPFAWPLLIATALFAALYPSAGLRNTIAALESALLENKEYDKLRAMTLDEVLAFAVDLKKSLPEPEPPKTSCSSSSYTSSTTPPSTSETANNSSSKTTPSSASSSTSPTSSPGKSTPPPTPSPTLTSSSSSSTSSTTSSITNPIDSTPPPIPSSIPTSSSSSSISSTTSSITKPIDSTPPPTPSPTPTSSSSSSISFTTSSNTSPAKTIPTPTPSPISTSSSSSSTSSAVSSSTNSSAKTIPTPTPSPVSTSSSSSSTSSAVNSSTSSSAKTIPALTQPSSLPKPSTSVPMDSTNASALVKKWMKKKPVPQQNTPAPSSSPSTDQAVTINTLSTASISPLLVITSLTPPSVPPKVAVVEITPESTPIELAIPLSDDIPPPPPLASPTTPEPSSTNFLKANPILKPLTSTSSLSARVKQDNQKSEDLMAQLTAKVKARRKEQQDPTPRPSTPTIPIPNLLKPSIQSPVSMSSGSLSTSMPAIEPLVITPPPSCDANDFPNDRPPTPPPLESINKRAPTFDLIPLPASNSSFSANRSGTSSTATPQRNSLMPTSSDQQELLGQLHAAFAARSTRKPIVISKAPPTPSDPAFGLASLKPHNHKPSVSSRSQPLTEGKPPFKPPVLKSITNTGTVNPKPAPTVNPKPAPIVIQTPGPHTLKSPTKSSATLGNPASKPVG